MALCPRCGAAHETDSDYCLNCGFDLRGTAQPEAAGTATPTQGTPDKRSYARRNVALAIIAVVGGLVLIYAFAGSLYCLGFVPTATAGQRCTWRQYGISIQYPVGTIPHVTGYRDPQATNDSGNVSWTWNNGNTYLELTWSSMYEIDPSRSMQNYEQGLLKENVTNLVMTAGGTVNMADNEWNYRSVSYDYGGQTHYATVAFAYYDLTGRGYGILYRDTNSSTLASLESYGSTFTG